MASTTPFLPATAARRSMYALSKTCPISNDAILAIITHAVTYAPSPFNVRSTRCILALGPAHTSLWSAAHTATALASPSAMPFLGPRIAAFGAAYGTVLFFDADDAVEALDARGRALCRQFPEWEEHASGMCQFVVWTALEAEGLGANLQHYQAGVGEFAREEWGVPEGWRLKAQLVFGGVVEGPGEEKARTGLEGAIRVVGV
ncbi:Nitroreductase [Polyplosphaeria fusca]|uniref:Nitroreductase n=1 Tax=Polyplosphaeria fusca TaxID=682080 RepID=A0A9P4R2E7_9PLEO|nr:Nitroreductase [Polyplosphaeria fusca]